MSWIQSAGTFLYHGAQVIYWISVSVFVAYTIGLRGPWKVKGDVSGQMNQTWSQTSSLLANAADIAKKVNKVLEGGAAAQQPAEAAATKKDQ